MSLPIDTRIPPYVHDLVVDAGRDNVYWATARDPGDRPGAGQTMDEWRNRVVGSGISATQSTASAQPIWRGDRLEFAGDDYLSLGSRSSIEKITLWVAGKSFESVDPASDDYISYESSSNPSRIGVRILDDLKKIDLFLTDKNGNTQNAGITREAIDLSAPFGVTVSVDVPSASVNMAVVGGGNSSTRSFTPPPDSFTDMDVTIGQRAAGGAYVEGGMKEVGIAEGYAASLDMVKAIRGQLQTKWGI